MDRLYWAFSYLALTGRTIEASLQVNGTRSSLIELNFDGHAVCGARASPTFLLQQRYGPIPFQIRAVGRSARSTNLFALEALSNDAAI